MRVSNLCFLIVIVFIASCKKDSVSSSSITDSPGCPTQIIPLNGVSIAGRYIVALSDASDTRSMSAKEISQFSSSVLSKNNIRSAALLQSFGGYPGGFIAQLTDDEVKTLKQDANVSKIENDRIIALSDPCFTVVEPGLLTWNVERVGYGDGTGKTAWVIDSGIDFSHPDLNVDTVRSRSFLTGISSANDENGHGTHVAGIIGALNNRIGVLGVASGATLVSLRILDKDGAGTAGGLIQALAYINTNAKAGDVVNISSGEDTASSIVDQQIKNTASKGIFITIAAGNDAKPAINYSPARANGTNIFTVSAIDSLDNFASFSNYGNDAVDYAAPGVKIVSTWKNGQYAMASGTSMAAPHVAGLLLLVGNNIKTSGTAKNDPDGTPDPIAHN
ncbi:MAG: S8 family serine peptidase [Chitinophagaceae bacterium]